MYFNEIINSVHNSIRTHTANRRTAVRAIIIEEEKILMVRSNLGYYKLPGGGVEEGESHAGALAREVAEETGYLDCSVGNLLGVITEQRPDNSAPNACFQMESLHYICKLITKQKTAQALIGYELEEGYMPAWISIEAAIDANSSIYEVDSSQLFLPRENFVLQWLQSHNASIELEKN